MENGNPKVKHRIETIMKSADHVRLSYHEEKRKWHIFTSYHMLTDADFHFINSNIELDLTSSFKATKTAVKLSACAKNSSNPPFPCREEKTDSRTLTSASATAATRSFSTIYNKDKLGLQAYIAWTAHVTTFNSHHKQKNDPVLKLLSNRQKDTWSHELIHNKEVLTLLSRKH